MATFSKRSKKNLSQCEQDLQILFNEVIKIADCSVLCGYRGEKEQNLAYSRGYSTVKFPNSKHNSMPAMAADVVPYPIDWEDEKRFIDFGNMVMRLAQSLHKDGVMKHRIEWGGNWSRFKDYPHFQIRV